MKDKGSSNASVRNNTANANKDVIRGDAGKSALNHKTVVSVFIRRTIAVFLRVESLIRCNGRERLFTRSYHGLLLPGFFGKSSRKFLRTSAIDSLSPAAYSLFSRTGRRIGQNAEALRVECACLLASSVCTLPSVSDRPRAPQRLDLVSAV